MSEGTIIAFKSEGGLRISKDNTSITTGKVIVNGIEITSVEDWTKVTQSIVELQQENQQLKDEINKISKKELKIMQMLRSIELCTLTKERIDQIEEVMFELNTDDLLKGDKE